MGERLTGKPVVQYLREEIQKKVIALKEIGKTPTIEIFRVGKREDDIAYEKGITSSCRQLGIQTLVTELPEEVTLKRFLLLLDRANQDDKIHGIIIFRPLPPHLDLDRIRKAIDPKKDIDCMSPVNLGKVFEGTATVIAPCTAKAVVTMLKHYQIPLKGANVAMVGSSLVVGRPLAMLLLEEHATVTLCHIHTKNLQEITRKADIVITAIGKAKFMTEEYFNPDSIVIDVGINDDGDGKICGDVNYDQVFNQVKAITPAIGGVGLVTTTILLDHSVEACRSLEYIRKIC